MLCLRFSAGPRSELPLPVPVTQGSLPLEFADLLRDMWGGRYRRVAPGGILRNLRRLNAMFEGYEQHDSQEALRFLLMEVHERLSINMLPQDCGPIVRSTGARSTVPAGTTPKLMSRASTPLLDGAATGYSVPAWVVNGPYTGHVRFQQSIISDIFRGIMNSHVRCSGCGHVSTTQDYFYDLSLPIPK